MATDNDKKKAAAAAADEALKGSGLPSYSGVKATLKALLGTLNSRGELEEGGSDASTATATAYMRGRELCRD